MVAVAFWAIDYLCLGVLVVAAILVVLFRNLNSSVMALSALGTVLAGKARSVVRAAEEKSLGEEEGKRGKEAGFPAPGTSSDATR
jgi:hypothetical protein